MIKKLKYASREAAEQDLLTKGILQEFESELVNAPITEAVVHIGTIVDTPATYDEQGEELTPATFLEGYHVDIMIKENVDFGENELNPTNPVHRFWGH